MSAYIIPVLILGLVVYAAFKKVPIYDCFTEGAKDAIHLIYSIFPYIIAIYVGVQLFKASGLGTSIAEFSTPFMQLIGIPPELTELIIIRPLSGSGSLAILEEIYEEYGADSHTARSASVIVGASETVFYIGAVYFSTTSVRKLRYAIPVALFATFVGAIVACLICRFI